MNLAISLAISGKSVILVDADLWRPKIHRAFGLDNGTGLTSVLLGAATLGEAVDPTPIEGLRVLTSGPLPPEPFRALGSEKARNLFETLQGVADTVVVDSAPVLVVADPLILSRYADAVLLVVDASASKMDAVKRRVESLQEARPKVMGAVLNQMTGIEDSHYYSSYEHGFSDGPARSNGRKGAFAWLNKLVNGKSKDTAGKPKA